MLGGLRTGEPLPLATDEGIPRLGSTPIVATMRQKIDNLEDRISEADSLEELVSLQSEVCDLFKEVTPTNERELVPKLCQLEEEINEACSLLYNQQKED